MVEGPAEDSPGVPSSVQVAASSTDDALQVTELSLSELQGRSVVGSLPIPTKNPPILPLSSLEPEVFERVVAEMVALRDSPSVHFYGRRGQRQYGLDIYEEQADEARVLYQVKRYVEITPTEIRAAVTDYAGDARRGEHGLPERRFNPRRFVVVTSAVVDDDTNKTDVIAQLQNEYRGDLGISVWGAEAVSRQLRESPSLVTAVFGEAWAKEFCGASNIRRAQKEAENRTRIDETLRAAMGAQYAKDNEIRFRQVELNGVTVESLFVDVPASSHPGSETDELLKRINPSGQSEQSGSDRAAALQERGDGTRGRSTTAAQAGAAQALLHPLWTDSTVIVGGPGQGKTTLLQFLCQYHRARVLDRSEYSPVAAGLNPVSDVLRTPIRVELTKYAEWRRGRLPQLTRQSNDRGSRPRPTKPSKAKPDTNLESYIAEVIADAGAQPFVAKDLATAVTSRAMLIALDGLDEVADSDERDQIADEIRTTNSRLQANGRDLQILIATRPGNVGRPIWRDPQFSALFLNQLTPPLRMKYLERWTSQSTLEPDEIDELKKTFTESITLPHVVELAGNPMQLAILLHLMQRRTVLPEKRTTLYERYIDVFMDREAKSTIVAENKDLIVAFHKLLAWHIHTRVELGKSTGTITLDDLRSLLTQYLEPRGRDTDFIAELFKSVTTRVLCLVQRDLDSNEFQFEVQPLREYFAAEHIFDMSPNDTSKNNRPACLDTLLRRPYWSNVMRFFAGKFAPGEVPAMIYVLKEMQRDRQIGDHPITRSAAKLLLDDHVLAGQVELVVADLVHVILDGPGPVLALDGLLQQDDSLLNFQERGGAKQAVEVLIDQIMSSDETYDPDAAAQLLEHFGALQQAARSWWTNIDTVEPYHWLRVAASLNALADPSLQQIKQLTSRLGALDANTSLTELLVRSRADSLDDRIVELCIDELKRGCATFAEQPDVGSHYGRLVAASGADNFYAHLRSTKSGGAEPDQLQAGRPGGGGRRVRLRSGSEAWNAHVDPLENAHTRDTDWSVPGVWHELLDSVASTWAEDCWPLREALFAVPSDAFPTGPEKPAVLRGASWRGLARWHVDAIEHRGDPGWWKDQSQLCDDPLATMTFVVSALAIPHSKIVAGLTDDLNAHLENLDQRRWATVAQAVLRYAQRRFDTRDLNLSEQLRLRQAKPGGRLAATMWHVSGDSTRTQLRYFIAADMANLWAAGPSVSLALRQFLNVHDKVLLVDQFSGSRGDLPEGSFRSVKLKALTFAQSQEILQNPQHWPTDLVRRAADHLGTRLAKQEPVSVVATANGWRA